MSAESKVKLYTRPQLLFETQSANVNQRFSPVTCARWENVGIASFTQCVLAGQVKSVARETEPISEQSL